MEPLQPTHDALDLDEVRIFVYTYLAEHGTPPTAAAIAKQMAVSPAAARDTLEALAKRRALILHPSTRDIWMAGPFSAVPTRFRVHGARASWFANCAWDMLGIPAVLNESVRIETSCADCDEPFVLEVDAQAGPRSDTGLVHFLVPASHWYEDIGFT